jgi:diacylglycerol kinase (ATP)
MKPGFGHCYVLELFSHGYLSPLITDFLSKIIVFYQAAAIKIEMRGGEWDRAYVQMDGEPWKQPLIQDQSTTVEISKVPYHSLMINGDQ